MHPINVPAKLEVHIASPVPELIWVPKNWGGTWLCPVPAQGEDVGGRTVGVLGDGTVRKSVGEFL